MRLYDVLQEMVVDAGYRVKKKDPDSIYKSFTIYSGALEIATVMIDTSVQTTEMHFFTRKIDFSNPDSFQQLKEELRGAWKVVMKESTWKFARLFLFWTSIVSLLIWGILRIATDDNGTNFNQAIAGVYQAGKSYDLETSVKQLDRAIDAVKVHEKKTTTIFWIYSQDEDVEIYKNHLKEWRTKFAEVLQTTNDLPVKEARPRIASLMLDYIQLMPLPPEGLSIYPYNRVMFIMFLISATLFGIALYINRHWFD